MKQQLVLASWSTFTKHVSLDLGVPRQDGSGWRPSLCLPLRRSQELRKAAIPNAIRHQIDTIRLLSQ
ncbi:MAG: hypothetical protein CFE24_13015 [Flavobacterium sp. BFFFF2]|nr:MAG: hypothetical protein CFE24_13015 [Flavobacterium sp. BFFFF2]